MHYILYIIYSYVKVKDYFVKIVKISEKTASIWTCIV